MWAVRTLFLITERTTLIAANHILRYPFFVVNVSDDGVHIVLTASFHVRAALRVYGKLNELFYCQKQTFPAS